MQEPIAFVDCNNFNTSCAGVFRPALRSKPGVVLSNNDGSVIARSTKPRRLALRWARRGTSIAASTNARALLFAPEIMCNSRREIVPILLARFGQDVRLIPPAYVKPYVRRGAKNDAAAAAAICEAVTCPNMRFVPIKSVENQAFLASSRKRPAGPPENHDGLCHSSHFAEFGIVVGQGRQRVDGLVKLLGDEAPAFWVADYNGERPHSALKYQAQVAYAAILTATGDRLRNPDQLRRSPVAPPAAVGLQPDRTLTAVG